MCTSPEKKKLININNLIAEIRNVQRIEKEITLTNSKKKHFILQENGT